MKYLFLLFFIPALSHSSPVNGGVSGADGKIHEMLSVVMSVSLNKIITQETEQGSEIPVTAYPETVRGVSLALSGMINSSEYQEFSFKWAKIFLRSGILLPSYFNATGVSFSSGNQDCQGNLNWVVSGYPEYGVSQNNPLPQLNGRCKQMPFKGTPGASFSTKSENVYSLPFNTGTTAGYINGYTVDDVVNYFNEVFRVHTLMRNDINYEDFMAEYPLCSGFRREITHDDEIKPTGDKLDFNVNGGSVSLISAYEIKLVSKEYAHCSSPEPVTRLLGWSDILDSRVYVNAPLYNERSQTFIKSIMHGGDELLLYSFLSQMSRKVIPAMAFSSILNAAWADISAQPDYKGLPYSESYRITESDVISVMNNRNLKPSAADMFDPVPERGIYLMYWSDTHNSYVTEEVFEASKKAEVDLGPNPGIDEPELVNGSLSDSLNPLFNVMPFLKNFRLDSHAATCPVWTYEVFGQSIPMMSFCTLIEQNRALISLFFIIQWTITSLIILVRT